MLPRINIASYSGGVLLYAFLLSAPAKDFELRVTARDRDYVHAIVTVPVPPEFPSEGELLPGSGTFQRDESGNVVFISPELKKGQSVVLRATAGRAGKLAEATVRENRVTLSIKLPADDKPNASSVLTYQGTETPFPRPDIKPIFKRGGYLHPVFSPSGKQITDDYPSNHVHHHGIWAPWTKTIFEGRSPDFWNMGEGKGRVEFVKLNNHWEGPVHAGFSAEQRFVDLTSGKPIIALNENWTVTTYQVRGYYAFDLVSTQTCATGSALELPKYYYGGLGLRGNWAWNGATNCFFLTSNGETDRVAGNETRGNWCYMGGLVDGVRTGITVLCHPDNFRAPQPMRLHPTEPFFCYAPSQLGDWSIEPGKPYVARYRFIVKDGAPDRKELDRLWEDYAKPPQVEVRAIE